MTTATPPAAVAAPPKVRPAAPPPVSPAPPKRHPFIQRHPFYGRFVVALEVLAVLLVACGVVGMLAVWWRWEPDLVNTSDRMIGPAGMMVSPFVVMVSAGFTVLISWLALAGSVAVVSMVGRLLLSIEGHVMRSAGTPQRGHAAARLIPQARQQ